MDIDKLTSVASRLFFVAAAVALAAGAVEKIANLAGYTLIRIYSPERLLEISVACAVFIIMLLVRQIRQEVRARDH